MNSGTECLRVPADFLREARRLFGRLRLRPGTAGAGGCPVEVCGGFDGISLAVADGRCRLETFRRIWTAEAGGRGCLWLSRRALAEACRADPGTVVELSACRQAAGTLLRLRCGGAWLESHQPPAGHRPPAAPAPPEGERIQLPVRTLEALATVAAFAGWESAAGLWRRGVCFSPADGGRLIAGDRRRLACVPAVVPPRAFRLPLAAVRVLRHPDFLGYANEVTLPRPGAAPRVMFRAWDHLLVAPMLPPGPWEDEARLVPDPADVRPLPLDEVEREHLLGWLRALRDPRAPVTVQWRDGGMLALEQGGECELQVPLRGRAGLRAPPPPIAWPRLRLSPRDLAAVLRFGGRLHIGVDCGGRALLACQGPGGAFCRVASLARAAAGCRGMRGSGRRPAA